MVKAILQAHAGNVWRGKHLEGNDWLYLTRYLASFVEQKGQALKDLSEVSLEA
jgi:hypothetical protein